MLYDPTHENEQSIDLRPLPPRQRHALVFRAIKKLGIDTSLILVNDHDPRPLHYQLQALDVGTLAWEYLDQGPDLWRVRIGKVASADCCGG